MGAILRPPRASISRVVIRGLVHTKIHGIVYTKPNNSTLQDLASIAQILAGIAAIFSLPFIAWQVYAARANATLDRTATVQAVWGARTFREELSPVIDFLDPPDVGDCMRKIRAWQSVRDAEDGLLPMTPGDPGAPSPSRNDVIHVLIFFEDLCQRYNLREINRRSVARSLGPVLIASFVEAAWFIHWSRALEQDDLVFSEWEMTLRHLRRHRRSWFRRAANRRVYSKLRGENTRFEIRAVCVPPEDADRDQWDRATRLSEALCQNATFDDRMVPSRKRLAAVHSAEVGSGWTVVLLPRSLDDSLQQRRWNRALAVAMEGRLNILLPAAIDDAIAELNNGQPVSDALVVSPQMESRWLWAWLGI